MVVELWRLRLEASLRPKVKISFIHKQKRNKKVSGSRHKNKKR